MRFSIGNTAAKLNDRRAADRANNLNGTQPATYADEEPAVIQSPRVLPPQGIDDTAVIKAIIVASVLWSIATIAAIVGLYGLYRMLKAKRRNQLPS